MPKSSDAWVSLWWDMRWKRWNVRCSNSAGESTGALRIETTQALTRTELGLIARAIKIEMESWLVKPE